ncbi:MAG: flagellar motor protein MotB [Flavobacteriaceae bacterium]|nr:MAG: flagellar motor protein MotB [Flavobacteriaceae bacterium]
MFKNLKLSIICFDMKKFNLLLAGVVAMLSTTATAQNSDNPWYISAGLHSVDHTSVNGAFDGFFDTKDYSFVPPLSRIVVGRNVAKGIGVDITASVGEIDNKAMLSGQQASIGSVASLTDKFFLNVGPGVRISPLTLITGNSGMIDPYLRLGANYNRLDYRQEDGTDVTGTVPNDADFDHLGLSAGAGLNVWVTENIALNVGADYNHFPETGGDNIDFFQHYYGLGFQFGNTDKDGDGVLNKEDNCPEVPGPADNQGCPWGDKDGDGVLDNVDNCPDVKGPAENKGCPWGDKDKDGILDNVDKCPSVAGVARLQGCPAPTTTEIAAQGSKLIEGLTFETNSAVLTGESWTKIEKAAAYIKENGGQYFVDGHTDSRGKDTYNMALSQKRAAAVVSALASKGVDVATLTSRGFGETSLKCDESTPEGLLCNRRVVFTAK